MCLTVQIQFFASALRLYNRTYKWLVLAESNPDPDIIFQNLSLYINAEIILATKNENQRLEANYTGFYKNDTGLVLKPQDPKYSVRNNFHKYDLRVATVVSRDLDDNEDDLIEMLSTRHPVRGIVGLTKYHNDIVTVVRDLLNYSIEYYPNKDWAGEAPNGTHLGVVGWLRSREVDISGTGFYMSGNRPEYMDFINGFWMFETGFMYRVSGLSGAQEGSLSKPFRDEVWIVTAVMAIVIFLFFKCSSANENVFKSWSFSALSILAAFCQQEYNKTDDSGMEPSPSHVAQRIACLVLYVATLLLYNYYTSSIVGFLLSVQPEGLKTIEQIASSSLTVVFEDVSYGRVLVEERFIPGLEVLYEKKLKPPRKQNQPGVFVVDKEGIGLLQKGGYAYHTEIQSAYASIGKTFDQQEICELRSVMVYQKAPLYIGMPKKSPLGEIFSIA
ncbi:ionotropic receptor 75a-like [Ctenocephalides felis]|uniref:ionotropic receptor 75a-like n=1 Tax=Ctenocephalides felis TaxID=7515 RepID=UPI000E6E4775|nr:ionotropic receptor 75a-like [Ctenocephalides felis]